MDHALPMRFVESVRNLDGVAQRLVEWKRTPPQPVGQRLSLDVFHNQEINVVLFADIVKGGNVGVIQAGDGSS